LSIRTVHLEITGFDDGVFDPQNAALLIIELDRVAIYTMALEISFSCEDFTEKNYL
jgi:hypothetical protein